MHTFTYFNMLNTPALSDSQNFSWFFLNSVKSGTTMYIVVTHAARQFYSYNNYSGKVIITSYAYDFWRASFGLRQCLTAKDKHAVRYVGQ